MPSQKPPRRGLAVMRLDLDFFNDPGVQLLYEDNPADIADAAVVLFIRMAMRAHRLDRPDVLEEFQRSKSERRHATLATLASAGLIDDKGIKPESFAVWRTPDSGWYDSDRGRAGGLARAATAERDDAGHFASVDQRATSVDQRGEPGTVRYGSVRGGSPPLLEGNLPNDEGSRSDERSEIQQRDDERFGDGKIRPEFEALALKAEALTGQAAALRNPFGGYAETLFSLVDIHGLEKVLRAMESVRQQLGRRMTIKELVFGTETLLSRGVSAAGAQKVERIAEIDDGVKKRVERTQMMLHGNGQHSDGADNHPACPACRGEVAV